MYSSWPLFLSSLAMARKSDWFRCTRGYRMPTARHRRRSPPCWPACWKRSRSMRSCAARFSWTRPFLLNSAPTCSLSFGFISFVGGGLFHPDSTQLQTALCVFQYRTYGARHDRFRHRGRGRDVRRHSFICSITHWPKRSHSLRPATSIDDSTRLKLTE